MAGIADSIRIAQDKDGMLRRALERIIQLYTDKSHFVYELLQNAEDAEAKSIRFVQHNDRLEVLHDGRPFTSDNLQGLCDIGKSDKADNLNQIGEFGVGFKSVFGICDTVKLYSVPNHFREKVNNAVPFAVEIKDFTRPEDIPEVEIDRSYTTRFVFPYVVGKSFSGFNSIEELNSVLSQKLQNLGVTTLLFMKNLESIEYKIITESIKTEGEYLLEKKRINGHSLLVSAIGRSAKDDISDDSIVSYLKFSRRIGEESNRTVDIAFPISIDEEGNYECLRSKNPYVSVYFPTETESKLEFIVQGPYRTTPNRSSIPADDKDNRVLANETAKLLKQTILELKESGKFNMSFVKVLPVNSRNFENYNLFRPLYDVVVSLFSTNEVIPCKDGGYVSAKCAKIARQERLAALLPDHLLTSLIGDGNIYHWLPTFLTENNREYEQVYRFLNGMLKVEIIRPDDLRSYFVANPSFLPARTDEWLVNLYSILENVGAAFSKSRNEVNMLTADIVKTTSGVFVAPFRKTESKTYIPNVFLPSDKIKSNDIYFVDEYLYERCRHFFDDILQLQKPNEYEFFIKNFEKRYENPSTVDGDEHIQDIKKLVKYIKYDEYHDEIEKLVKEEFVLLCSDNRLRRPFSSRIFFAVNEEGIRFEDYYKNITNNVFFVKTDYYVTRGVTLQELKILGVQDSLLTGDSITSGLYDIGGRGRQPEWWTLGDFKWKLSMDVIKDVLKYISSHPNAKDSIIKSQVIMQVLFANEDKLVGTVKISRNIPNLENETCELIKILKGEHFLGWDGKWLYTDSFELISQRTCSKYDISTSIYGNVKVDSSVYDYLGFKRTEADEVDDLKKTVPKKKLDAFFESELKKRFGITSEDLNEKFSKYSGSERNENDDISLPFPVSKVKNWDTLKKHAAEMLIYANPVKYEYAVRRIRVSNQERDARAYLHNMYRYDGVYKYACQMCHEACTSIERAQLFNNPETELDPMNLCLCPNCATQYRLYRNNESLMKTFKDNIMDVNESEVSNGEQVAIHIGNHEIWFTQTHFAEIQSLLKLSSDVQREVANDILDKKQTVENTNSDGLSVYSGYVGKHINRVNGDFSGIIISMDEKYIQVKIDSGNKAGLVTKLQTSFVINNKGKYIIK